MRCSLWFCVVVFISLLCISEGMPMEAHAALGPETRPKKLNVEDIASNRVISNFTSESATLAKAEYANLHFKNVHFEKPVFENVTFTNCSFTDVEFRQFKFVNVAFKNCEFDGSRLFKGDLLNVTFDTVNKRFLVEQTSENRVTKIERVTCGPVFLRNTEINTFYMPGVRGRLEIENGGSAQAHDLGTAVVGGNLTVLARNSNFHKVRFSLGANSRVSAVNCGFTHGGGSGSEEETTVAYFENCKFFQSSFAKFGLLVIKNSEVNAGFSGKGQWYFENCTFPLTEVKDQITPRMYSSGLFGGKGTKAYILGSPQTAYLKVKGGEVTLYNISLQSPTFENRDRRHPVPALNMRNVEIHGGKWQGFTMGGGQWENVRIYPTVELGMTNLGMVRTRKLEFPKGNPWDGEAEGGMKESATPFEWPEVHVPTKEELGFTTE